ncbi:MAG: nucleotidyltransferase [Microthrixaceae bacterium]|nr:nucleotidyltransferase [Microthrixaceae bacterium]
MSRDWESAFRQWGSPPSQTEQDQISRAEREIRAVLDGFASLGDREFRVYLKGSHRRGTNVRRGSDVDMAVELRGVKGSQSWQYEQFFEAEGLTKADLGMVDIPPAEAERLKPDQFKKAVYDALTSAFGRRAVSWSNKCIRVREGTSLPVDVVPCRFYRRYDGPNRYHEGIQIRPDSGPLIVNWPRQDDENGTAKNARTNQRYKRAVRGVKALENEMTDAGSIEEVPSFMMECAIFNVPDVQCAEPSNYANCLAVLRTMEEVAGDPATYSDWVEVNDLKYLFRATQS